MNSLDDNNNNLYYVLRSRTHIQLYTQSHLPHALTESDTKQITCGKHMPKCEAQKKSQPTTKKKKVATPRDERTKKNKYEFTVSSDCDVMWDALHHSTIIFVL